MPLLLIIARLFMLSAVRLEAVVMIRFETTLAQVLLLTERNGDGEFQRRVLEEVFAWAVGCRCGHMCVHVISVLQLTLRAFRLQRVEIVQVAQLEVLVGPASGLWRTRTEKKRGACQSVSHSRTENRLPIKGVN